MLSVVRERSDAGPEPRDHLAWRDRHARERRLDHAARKPAPSGVRDAHDSAAAVRKQHRHAVGGQHGADAVPRVRNGAVGTGQRLRGLGVDNRGAVDLLQPDRVGRQTAAQDLAVVRHRRRVVADASAQIQGGEGAAAGAPRAGRHQRANRRRGRPVRNDPVVPRRRPHRRLASNARRSAGSGAAHSQWARVTGCVSPRRAACRACRGKSASVPAAPCRLPYVGSPTSG